MRKAAPESALIVDANEGWTPDNLEYNLAACANAGVTLVEQPLPAGRDEALARIRARSRSAPTKACTTAPRSTSCAALRRRQHQARQDRRADGSTRDGGRRARARFEIMVGCMVATSLAMAPAMLLAQQAAICRSRWSAAAGTRSRERAAVRRQSGLSAGSRLVGLMGKPLPCQPDHQPARRGHRGHHVIDALPPASVDRA